jgi:uncharacterized membrane protein YgaE (UPF0421/DUF939 family)
MLIVRTFAAFVFLSVALPLQARDVSREQSAVQYARQEFENADAEYKADAEQAARTKKEMEALKKKLDAEQKKASISATKRQQAKARLEKAEQALDKAWKQ